MSTTIYTCPAGQTILVPAPARSSICVQPGTGGTAQIAVGPSNAPGQGFVVAPQGANTAPYSLATDSYASIMGNLGVAQITAGVAACQAIVSDISEYPGSYVERQTVALTGVAMTLIAANTNELNFFSMRFPAGYLKPNFKLEWRGQCTVTNSATVKTLKAYFGPSTNSATAAALEGGTALQSTAFTSVIGGHFAGSAFGRNDNQTVIASNAGLVNAGGWGGSVTANVSVTSANYSGPTAVEQVFALTGTKATGTDTFTLDGLIVQIYQ